jgi:predicted transcriptional regulator of viral defense system
MLRRHARPASIPGMPDAPYVRHHIDAERWARPDAAIAALATRQHGVVARRQLVEIGLGRGAIARRLEAGRLHLLHRGVYAVGHRRLTREASWMAATLVAEDAVLSHRSAAGLWGIWRGERARVEITLPRWIRARTGLQIHEAHLAHDEVTSHRGIPVTSPARTLLDLAAVLGPQQLERAATEAEIQRLGSAVTLDALVRRHAGRPGTAALRKLLQRRAIGRNVTRRELELRFLAFLDAHGLPRPRVNATLDLPPRPREVDCLWPDGRLVAELDGFATHGTRAAFEDDRARDRALQVAGYRVIRVTWRHLTEDGPVLAAQVRALLG